MKTSVCVSLRALIVAHATLCYTELDYVLYCVSNVALIKLDQCKYSKLRIYSESCLDRRYMVDT